MSLFHMAVKSSRNRFGFVFYSYFKSLYLGGLNEVVAFTVIG